jgi:tetratricopeptide (TPR) repeat protein
LRSQLKERPLSHQLEEQSLNTEPIDKLLERKHAKAEKATIYDPLAFGCELRTQRLKLGWSASQLSECYAEFVGREDSPPDPTFIYHIERGVTMIGLERRAILASLVGIPLALAGVHEPDSSTTLDVSEYTQALEVYCSKLRDGTIQEEEGAIQERTRRLEAVSFQTGGEEKMTLIELFGFYQILQADVYTWDGQTERASTLLSSTVEIARQEKLFHLFTHALTQRAGTVLGRFETTRDPGSIQTAIDDYKSALQESDKLSPLYCGLLNMRSGLADAYLARDTKAFTDALQRITQGSNQIGLSPDDVRIVARLDFERSMLTRASSYLYSPMGNPGLALAELKELDRWCPQSRGKGRLAQRNRLFAEAYLATGNYPMTASYLEAALESAPLGEVNRLVEIHARLKNTSYWNDPDIGRIAVKINQMKYPDLFPRVGQHCSSSSGVALFP